MGIILKPFALLLMFFYEFFNSYGIALILFGIVVKMVLFPVTLKSKKSMIQTNMLSGKMQQLKNQYGKDPERYNMEVQKLYEKENVNPMGGCLWSLVPMFVLIGLYAIIREPLFQLMDVPEDMIEQVANAIGVANTGSYPQIAMAEALNDPAKLAAAKTVLGEAGDKLMGINFSFLGMNLANIPNMKFWESGVSVSSILLFLLPFVSAAVSFLSMRVMMKTNEMNTGKKQDKSNPQMDQTNKMMNLMMPLMSLWIGFTVPAGLSIYWISQYFVSMLQEVVCGKILKKDYEAARKAAEEQAMRDKEEEKKRREEARLERARRIEEEKNNKGKKKKTAQKQETDSTPGINKDDSREGLRAYARGRAYMPDRFGGVTPYIDPNGSQQPVPQAEPVEESTVAPAQEEKPQTAPAVPAETEEVEVEVEQIEVEVTEEDNKEEA